MIWMNPNGARASAALDQLTLLAAIFLLALAARRLPAESNHEELVIKIESTNSPARVAVFPARVPALVDVAANVIQACICSKCSLPFLCIRVRAFCHAHPRSTVWQRSIRWLPPPLRAERQARAAHALRPRK